jgi:hypothetical protein
MANRKEGLYLIAREPDDGSDDWGHTAILDVGNVANYGEGNQNMIIQMLKNSGFSAMSWEEYFKRKKSVNDYEVVELIQDSSRAIARIKEFRKNWSDRYSAFFNNCEHFGYYVAFGEKESPTKQNILIAYGVVIAVALFKFFSNSGDDYDDEIDAEIDAYYSEG